MYVYIYIHTEAETKKNIRITHEYSYSNIANSSLGVYNTPYVRNTRKKREEEEESKTTPKSIEDEIRSILSAMNDEI